jgi:hypothetical protein
MNSRIASPEKTAESDAGFRRKPLACKRDNVTISKIQEHSPAQQTAGNLATQRLLHSRAMQPKLIVSQPGDVHEREADSIAEQVMSGRRLQPGERNLFARESMLQQKPSREAAQKQGSLTDRLPADSGRPLSASTLHHAEPALGADFGHVRLHDSPSAQMTAATLGARAFTLQNHIWLGPQESESDRLLMAHELAHVLQQREGLYLRRATWIERRAWLGFFDHYLPRKFLNNYMDDTGTAITLTQQEMVDVNPRVNITTSLGFRRELTDLQAKVKASAAAGTPTPAAKYIEVSGPGQAMTNGTLGNFTIRYKGMLTVNSDGTWTFVGTMSFYDIWDFDPKPFGTSGRSTPGEIKVRVAAVGLPGQPFEIFSVDAPLTQTGSDPRAVWAGGTPTFVNDKLGRAGADTGSGADVGGVGGDVAAGPDIGVPRADVGGESGAQGAEDLNR